MQELEFFGGPFDGHRENLDAGRPADQLAWPVCDEVFKLLSGRPTKNAGTVTSVAIYELEVDDGLFRYDFSFSTSFKEFLTSLGTHGIQVKKAPLGD